MASVAVLDANVLIPNALCDTLLRLAEADIFVPRWSALILDEVRRNVPQLEPAAIDRRIMFMNAAFEDALVRGFEGLIPSMTNHPKDRHVLAAAAAADADLIITCNLRDFRLQDCAPHGVEAIHPDDFLLAVVEREPALVARVIREQAAATGRRGPALSPDQVLDYLGAAGAAGFAARMRTELKS